jgi:serine/threonine-protein phosphatase 6 regulatory ankyrin repeat subunit B
MSTKHTCWSISEGVAGSHFNASYLWKESSAYSLITVRKTATFFRNGLQFLHVAAYYGLSSIFKTVLPSAHMLHKDARYADWHAFDRLGRPPLWYAAHRGHLGVVRQFLQVMEDRCLDHADKNKRTPVLAAAISGHDEVVELLASHDGIRINQRDVTGEAIAISSAKQGNLKILRTIMQRQDVNLNLQDRFGRTPLHNAVFCAHYNVVRALLDRRDVNRNCCDQNGAAPLHTAVSVGNFDIVELLLSLPGSGASSSGSHEQLARYQGASYAETLRLESASDSGTEYSANIVDINLQDRAGKTALMRATYPDLARIARVLLEHRADVHLKDIHGRTSLIRAVQEGSFTIVQLLLTHGANVADRDLNCNTPLGYALEISNRYDCGSIKWKRYAQIVKLLESFNATESEITKVRFLGV